MAIRLSRRVRKDRPPIAGSAPVDVAAHVAALAAQGRYPQTPPDITQALDDQGLNYVQPFAPGRPLNPFAGYSVDPRQWNFVTGTNIASRPRTGRISFETLRDITYSYDVARMCIEHRIDDVRSLDWGISPLPGVETEIESELKVAQVALDHPDGATPFASWLSKFLEDVLRYDAGTLFRRRNNRGDAIGLEIVDGSTIQPLLDYWGRPPLPPAPAYVQYIQGVPWDWLTSDDLIYQPFRPQPDSPYGLAPLEWVLLTANTDIRFQWYFLQAFTEGTLPEGLLEAPPDRSSVDAIKELQDAWDAFMYSDQAKKHQGTWVPAGTHYQPVKDMSFTDAFPLFLMRKVCAAFHVTPNDLGFTENVNRATGDTQVDVQFRTGTLPLVRHVEGILNAYLQSDLGLRVEFAFDTGGEKEDRLTLANAWGVYIDKGIASPDEAREALLGLPTDPQRPTARFYNNTRQGPIPLLAIEAVAGKVDPETFGPAKDQPIMDHVWVPPVGVVPHAGTTDEKASLAATDAEQANMATMLNRGGAGETDPTDVGTIGQDVTKQVAAGEAPSSHAVSIGSAPDDEDATRSVAHLVDSIAFNERHATRHLMEADADLDSGDLDGVRWNHDHAHRHLLEAYEHSRKLVDHLAAHPEILSELDKLTPDSSGEFGAAAKARADAMGLLSDLEALVTSAERVDEARAAVA